MSTSNEFLTLYSRKIVMTIWLSGNLVVTLHWVTPISTWSWQVNYLGM